MSEYVLKIHVAMVTLKKEAIISEVSLLGQVSLMLHNNLTLK